MFMEWWKIALMVIGGGIFGVMVKTLLDYIVWRLWWLDR